MMPHPTAKFIVVEGPENTGKSSLATDLTSALGRAGIAARCLSFPGREPKTLGALIYRVEHEAAAVGVDTLTPSARQALHLAAHLDGIERQFLPLLNAGTWIVLDRFWWSMWAHGTASGVPRHLLDQLVAIEVERWSPYRPSLILSTNRPTPFTDPATPHWHAVREAYELLVQEYRSTQEIAMMPSEADRATRVQLALARLLPCDSPP
jgi:hypothetical protein